MALYTEIDTLHERQASALSEEDLHAGVLERLAFSSRPLVSQRADTAAGPASKDRFTSVEEYQKAWAPLAIAEAHAQVAPKLFQVTAQDVVAF